MKSGLSRKMETKGYASRVSSGEGVEWRSVMAPEAGGCNTKKSLAMTLAVMWEGADGTQEASSLP